MRSASLAVLAVALTATTARANPKADCISAADRGQSARDDGKLKLARESFITCARGTCPALVAKSCAQWLHDVDDAIPSIVVGARDERGNDVFDGRVLADDELLTDKLDGRAIPIDPGEHRLRLERAGHPPLEQHVVIRASEKNRIVTFMISPTAGSAPGAHASGGEPQGASDTATPSFLTPRNVVALSLVGLAGVAVGSAVYLGVQSRSNADTAAHYRATDAPGACVGLTSPLCRSWSDAVDAQNRDAIASYTLYAAGGLLAAGAVASWLLWPRDRAPATAGVAWISPFADATRVGVGAEGSF